jgi:hypothetical protein
VGRIEQADVDAVVAKRTDAGFAEAPTGSCAAGTGRTYRPREGSEVRLVAGPEGAAWPARTTC